jgi:hypothetical protein
MVSQRPHGHYLPDRLESRRSGPGYRETTLSSASVVAYAALSPVASGGNARSGTRVGGVEPLVEGAYREPGEHPAQLLPVLGRYGPDIYQA